MEDLSEFLARPCLRALLDHFGKIKEARQALVECPDLKGALVSPAIYPWHELAEIGGLITYGPDVCEARTQAGRYAGLIRKDASPGNLPVQLPTEFRFVINLATARSSASLPAVDYRARRQGDLLNRTAPVDHYSTVLERVRSPAAECGVLLLPRMPKRSV
jgi:hypothetical protein